MDTNAVKNMLQTQIVACIDHMRARNNDMVEESKRAMTQARTLGVMSPKLPNDHVGRMIDTFGYEFLNYYDKLLDLEVTTHQYEAALVRGDAE